MMPRKKTKAHLRTRKMQQTVPGNLMRSHQSRKLRNLQLLSDPLLGRPLVDLGSEHQLERPPDNRQVHSLPAASISAGGSTNCETCSCRFNRGKADNRNSGWFSANYRGTCRYETYCWDSSRYKTRSRYPGCREASDGRWDSCDFCEPTFSFGTCWRKVFWPDKASRVETGHFEKKFHEGPGSYRWTCSSCSVWSTGSVPGGVGRPYPAWLAGPNRLDY